MDPSGEGQEGIYHPKPAGTEEQKLHQSQESGATGEGHLAGTTGDKGKTYSDFSLSSLPPVSCQHFHRSQVTSSPGNVNHRGQPSRA